jgi:hypothetical protein
MTLRLEPVLVDTGSDDEEGLLVFSNDRLVAVLVRLSDQHDSSAGSWFIESSFGIRDGHRTFPDLTAAQEWISAALLGARR